MGKFFVAPLIGKGDSIDDPIRPVVRGNFTMASNPSRDLKRVLVLSEKMPEGAREAQDKDFEKFGVRRGWIRMKER
ncbi:unnamed protein product [marine sediment metagenome]|uniref:Uncharacterized protein n=1 Tax=marine sediment metagenome TaxID=412755 RepID=X1QG99_9ZZZZ